MTKYVNDKFEDCGVQSEWVPAGTNPDDILKLISGVRYDENEIIAVQNPPERIHGFSEILDVIRGDVDEDIRYEVRSVVIEEFTVFAYDPTGLGPAFVVDRILNEAKAALSKRGEDWNFFTQIDDPIMTEFESLIGRAEENEESGHSWIQDMDDACVLWAYDGANKKLVGPSEFIQEMIRRHFPWDRDASATDWRKLFGMQVTASSEDEEKKMPMAEFRRRFEPEIAEYYHALPEYQPGVNYACRIEVMFDPDDVPRQQR